MLVTILKKFIVIIFLSGFIWGSCSKGHNDINKSANHVSSNPQEEVAKYADAELILTNKWIDFGNVSRDTVLIAKYNFTNSGKDTLIINSVQPDCFFKNYTLSNETVPPGDSAYVLLELVPGNMSGYLKGHATLQTNTYTRFYNLTLTAFIE